MAAEQLTLSSDLDKTMRDVLERQVELLKNRIEVGDTPENNVLSYLDTPCRYFLDTADHQDIYNQARGAVEQDHRYSHLPRAEHGTIASHYVETSFNTARNFVTMGKALDAIQGGKFNPGIHGAALAQVAERVTPEDRPKFSNMAAHAWSILPRLTRNGQHDAVVGCRQIIEAVQRPSILQNQVLEATKVLAKIDRGEKLNYREALTPIYELTAHADTIAHSDADKELRQQLANTLLARMNTPKARANLELQESYRGIILAMGGNIDMPSQAPQGGRQSHILPAAVPLLPKRRAKSNEATPVIDWSDLGKRAAITSLLAAFAGQSLSLLPAVAASKPEVAPPANTGKIQKVKLEGQVAQGSTIKVSGGAPKTTTPANKAPVSIGDTVPTQSGKTVGIGGAQSAPGSNVVIGHGSTPGQAPNQQPVAIQPGRRLPGAIGRLVKIGGTATGQTDPQTILIGGAAAVSGSAGSTAHTEQTRVESVAVGSTGSLDTLPAPTTAPDAMPVANAATLAFDELYGTTPEVATDRINMVAAQDKLPAAPDSDYKTRGQQLATMIEEDRTANSITTPSAAGALAQQYLQYPGSYNPATVAPLLTADAKTLNAIAYGIITSSSYLGGLSGSSNYPPAVQTAISQLYAQYLLESTSPSEQATLLASLPTSAVTVQPGIVRTAPAPTPARPVAPRPAAPAPERAPTVEHLSTQQLLVKAADTLISRNANMPVWKNCFTVLAYFLRQGYRPETSSGFAGNTWVESSCDPQKVQGGAEASSFPSWVLNGVAGWDIWQDTSSGRQQGLMNYQRSDPHHRPLDDLSLQLDWGWHELQTSYQGVVSQLHSVPSGAEGAAAAASIVMGHNGSGFENPNPASAHEDWRRDHAVELYNDLMREFTALRAAQSRPPVAPRPAPVPHPIARPAAPAPVGATTAQVAIATEMLSYTKPGPFQERGVMPVSEYTTPHYIQDLDRYGAGEGASTDATDCGAAAATAIRASVDRNFPELTSGNMLNYVRSSSQWEIVPNHGPGTVVRQGDVFVNDGHIYIVVRTAEGLRAAEASQYNHGPEVDSPIYWSNDGQPFTIARFVGRPNGLAR